MAGAAALVVLVGNAYTLDIEQTATGPDYAVAAVQTIAPPGHVAGAGGLSSGQGVASAPGATRPHSSPGGRASHAVLLALQDFRDATGPADEASGDGDGDAPGMLTPAAFEFSRSADDGSSAGDGGFSVSRGNSGEFGAPSGGGFMSNPSSGAGSAAGASNQAANTASQGVQPLRATPNVSGPAPEPSTWALLALGLGGVGAAMRSQRRRRAI